MKTTSAGLARPAVLLFAAAALAVAGCSSAKAPPRAAATRLAGQAPVGEQQAGEPAPQAQQAANDAQDGRDEARATKKEVTKKVFGGAPAEAVVVPRKVIYNATIDLIAEDLGATEQEVRQLVKRVKGYIAQSELQGTAGTRRSGTWTIRVPVSQFDDFREGLLKLGEVQRDSLDSQDVTDQFYDLEARIRTNQAEEESLRKLLEQARGQQEFYQLRQELSRIRGDLEVQQGQLQRLDKLSALATYHLTIQERRGYVPPETPSFDRRLARTWGESIDTLRTFGPAVVLVAVALAPWLPVIALIAAPVVLVARRRPRSSGASATVEPAAPPAS